MPFLVTMPKLSPTMEEGTLLKWHKKVGDLIKPDDLLIEVATDKATVEYNALDGGYLRAILIEEGQGAKINDPIAIVSEKMSDPIDAFFPKKEEVAHKKKEPSVEEVKRPEPQAASSPLPSFTPEAPLPHYAFPFPAAEGGATLASPYAKKVAKEKGIDLTSVKGSGPRGRIVSQDLDLAQPNLPVSFGPREIPSIPPGTYEETPLSPMRKVVGTRLQQAKSFIPHFYITQSIDASPLFHLREELKSGGLKITFNDLIVRAAALSLREHPRINAGFNSKEQAIISFKTIDISIAVTVEGGLITPIVRHADYKNVGEISAEIKLLADKAKKGKLEPHEYKGGSFTISNLGMYGVSEFVAILNPPQAAILAVAGIEEVAVISGGKVVPGKRLNLTLSADHRVIDGSDGALFIRTVKKYLENPSLLLI